MGNGCSEGRQLSSQDTYACLATYRSIGVFWVKRQVTEFVQEIEGFGIYFKMGQ